MPRIMVHNLSFLFPYFLTFNNPIPFNNPIHPSCLCSYFFDFKYEISFQSLFPFFKIENFYYHLVCLVLCAHIVGNHISLKISPCMALARCGLLLYILHLQYSGSVSGTETL